MNPQGFRRRSRGRADIPRRIRLRVEPAIRRRRFEFSWYNG
ncbi:hypothetical protein EDC23_0802 [Thiohalophilus thiocyanatoxydans]|uniref:Uncharacterized protein n=1 Tax=Thiohalophilus thiocyanatoxydans TaxID=381308 RepID=A0A4R8INI0_9GAMM|nr:hypothetical protein EDC23_0802 [Thiohalophilus thiocyanatoxydans]